MPWLLVAALVTAMPITALWSTSVMLDPMIEATVWPGLTALLVLAALCSSIETRLGLEMVSTGASLTPTTVMSTGLVSVPP